jgi:hypothetical protein
MERIPAARAGMVVDIDHPLDPRQMRRQRSAVHPAPRGRSTGAAASLTGSAAAATWSASSSPNSNWPSRQRLGPAAWRWLHLLDDPVDDLQTLTSREALA